ncbi:MAG: TldD/PmbA family protein [Polyangiaceae bacterium]|nr:TldD/PmbA family protein [Polyangiaceae bacterium]
MTLEARVRALAATLFSGLPAGQSLTAELKAESSDFVRVARTRVRQAGHVDEAELSLRLVARRGDALHEATRSFTLGGEASADLAQARRALDALADEVRALPASPFAEEAAPRGSSRRAVVEAPASSDKGALLDAASGLDLSGHVAEGTITRAVLSSAGTEHWFETARAVIDASAYAENGKAVKLQLAGEALDPGEWTRLLDDARSQLTILARPPARIEPGARRAYLGPMAVAELVEMMSWGCVGEAAIQQGDSPLRRARALARPFSPLFSLSEDFTRGDVPAFTGEGDLAPDAVPIVTAGHLVGSLVSARTAREYGVRANGAEQGEAMRAPSIAPGDLAQGRALPALGDGLYIPNLHYLNWSDQPGGRITGMTRYATMLVRGGEAVAPIADLRFDDTIFRVFGASLAALDDRASLVPATLTYEFRSLGGARVPGVLLSELSFAS